MVDHLCNDELHTWLLDAATPSIRYLTRRLLLDASETDDDVIAARRDIHAVGPVPAILAPQTEEGHWAGERSYYTPKYTSTHWSMLLLTELAADGSDVALRRGAEFMLTATSGEVKEAHEGRERGLACFWGNLLRYVVHCGYARDPRVGPVVAYLRREAGSSGWRCRYNGDLPCAWGVARALWGLAAWLQQAGAAGIRADGEAVVESGLTFLLTEHQLVDARYPTRGRRHPMWFDLNFPLFYQADLLFVLRVLADLNAPGRPGAQAALEGLAAKREPDGRWAGARPVRARTYAALGDAEETDRWASLHAASVLRRAGWAGVSDTR